MDLANVEYLKKKIHTANDYCFLKLILSLFKVSGHVEYNKAQTYQPN